MKPFIVLRHLVSIAALPFVVVVVVPLWLARRNGTAVALGSGAGEILVQVAGMLFVIVGLMLFGASLERFATEGGGTLAPWDPPRRLVVRGPYRFVRNPMISGVVFVVLGLSFGLLSWPHVQWALVFLAANLVYIPLVEEPMLRRRFGADYAEYCRHVPRLVPRLRPWESGV